MTQITRMPVRSFFIFGMLAVAVLAIETWLVHSASFHANPDVFSFAVTVDICVGVPLLYYFLVGRKSRKLSYTTLSVFLGALAFASFMLPADRQTWLNYIKELAAVLEIVIFIYFVYKFRHFLRNYREARKTEVYGAEAITTALRRTFGATLVTTIIGTESTLLYYSIMGWFMKWKPIRSDILAFTYYRRSGVLAMLGAFAGLIVVETAAVHLLLHLWNALVAWVVTALSIYSLLWLVGYIHSIRLQPHTIDGQTLHLRSGLVWKATIPFAAVATVRAQKPTAKDDKDKQYVNMATGGQPNLLLTLKSPLEVEGIFGRRKKVSRIGITVDDTAQFQNEIGKRLGNND